MDRQTDKLWELVRDYQRRPDTWQSSRGRFGGSINAKLKNVTDGPTDRPTRQGVESRVRDYKLTGSRACFRVSVFTLTYPSLLITKSSLEANDETFYRLNIRMNECYQL